MKRSLLALAVLGAFAGAAAAQSSVTLFGVVDLSLKEVKNGSAKAKQMGSDGIQSSRFGVRGVEDLGGGLQGGFHLEGGLNAGPGSAEANFWQRRATVSLLGGFGEVRLGRDLNPMFLGHASYDPFGTVGVGTIFNIISPLGALVAPGAGLPTLVRTSNMLAYLTPASIPFYAHVGISPSEAGTNTAAKFTGGRVGWRAGPFDASVALAKTETTTADDYEQVSVGGSWDFGWAKLFAVFLRNEFGTLEQDVIQLAATAPVGPGVVKLLYGDSSMDGGAAGSGFAAGDDARLISLQYVYNLSKRTALYGTFSDLKNEGASSFVVGSTFGQAITPAVGFKSRGYEFGVRHAF